MKVADFPFRRRVDAARYVRDALRTSLLAGSWSGRPLPTESELMAQLSVSRNAVRDGLDLLRDEGLVERVRGSGTFALTSKVGHNLAARDVASSLPQGPQRIRYEVVALHLAHPLAPLTDSLSLPDGEMVLHIERLVFMDDRPLSLWFTSLPGRYKERLTDEALTASPYHLLVSFLGVHAATTEVVFEPTSTDAAVAPLLEVSIGTPLLLMDRLVKDPQGQPVEHSIVRHRGERILLRSQLVAG